MGDSTFSDRLKTARKATGLSQKALSDLLSTRQGTYSTWETGEREPSFTTLSRICSVLKVSTDWLLGLSDNQKSSEPLLLKEDEGVYEDEGEDLSVKTRQSTCGNCSEKDKEISNLKGQLAMLEKMCAEEKNWFASFVDSERERFTDAQKKFNAELATAHEQRMELQRKLDQAERKLAAIERIPSSSAETASAQSTGA